MKKEKVEILAKKFCRGVLPHGLVKIWDATNLAPETAIVDPVPGVHAPCDGDEKCRDARKFTHDEIIGFHEALAEAHKNTEENVAKGRNMTAGKLRGLMLQFNVLAEMLKSDPFFRQCLQIAQELSLVSEYNLINLFLLIKYGLKDIEGNVVEFGSYRGGSALFMAMALKKYHPDKKIYSLDTFSGMPETDAIDTHGESDFNDADINLFRQKKEELELDNLVIVQGRFEDTFPGLKAELGPIALAHIDCDIHSAVIYAIEQSKSLMASSSGYLVFDDPLYSSCLGAFEAVEDTLGKWGCHAEQAYPHLVYRYPPLEPDSGNTQKPKNDD